MYVTIIKINLTNNFLTSFKLKYSDIFINSKYYSFIAQIGERAHRQCDAKWLPEIMEITIEYRQPH